MEGGLTSFPAGLLIWLWLWSVTGSASSAVWCFCTAECLLGSSVSFHKVCLFVAFKICLHSGSVYMSSSMYWYFLLCFCPLHVFPPIRLAFTPSLPASGSLVFWLRWASFWYLKSCPPMQSGVRVVFGTRSCCMLRHLLCFVLCMRINLMQ